MLRSLPLPNSFRKQYIYIQVTIIVVGIGDRTRFAGIVDPQGDVAPHRSAGRVAVVEAVRPARGTEIEESLRDTNQKQIRRKLTTTHCS